MRLPRPTYAGVAATLALVVALSGTAYAAGLPRHSVGTKQLKSGAVTAAKLKPGAVGQTQPIRSCSERCRTRSAMPRPSS